MVRFITEKDRNDFIAMAQEFYQMPAVLHSVPTENFEHTFDLMMEHSPFVSGMIAEYNGQTAGYALLAHTYSNEVGEMVVWIEEMFVKPQFRSCGIGKELFSFIYQQYDQQVKRYRLEVTKDNTRAVKLYEALGYEPLEYLQMVKDL
jgi:ribosomal protein S18 acetylase RimI-like enzyme